MGSLGSMVIKSGYDNTEKLAKVKCPTLIVHGKKDKIISYQQSVAIYRR